MGDSTKTGKWANIEDTVNNLYGNIGATAQGADALLIMGPNPVASKVSSVEYYPAAAIAGADNDTRRVRLYNRKGDNSGAVVVAELSFVNGVNAGAKQKKAITLSATAADLLLAAGDVLEWATDHVGNGLADPGGRVVVKSGYVN